MSSISLKEFLEKAAQDPELGEKLAALTLKYDEKLRALAAGAGFELEEPRPLSDEEASGAAGGAFYQKSVPEIFDKAPEKPTVVLPPDVPFEKLFERPIYELLGYHDDTEYCVGPY